MFDAWRKTELDEPLVAVSVPEISPALRDEVDSDPLIEEMVARLRDGLSNLVAIDEWGRPLAWRNVVRLALGPLAGRLRDTEQALELAMTMIPTPEVVAAQEYLDDVAPEQYLPTYEASIPEVEPLQAPQPAAATVEVILPAAEATPEVPVPEEVHGHAILQEEQVLVEEATPQPVPSMVQQPAVQARPGAASLFTVSGDQRTIAVSPLSPGQLLRGSSAYDSTSAKYDRFLTGLYGERQQVRGDEDSGPA